MVLSIVFHTKLSPIYPEYNRNRLAYVHAYGWIKPEAGKGSSGFPWQIIDPLFANLENAEALSLIDEGRVPSKLRAEGSDNETNVRTRCVNDGFFRVYTYDFLAGSPFTAAEISSKAKVAILDRPTAEKLFGSVEGAIGKTIFAESLPLTIKGVVREASRLTEDSYGNFFMPLSLNADYGKEADYGGYRPTILLKEGSSIPQLREELLMRYKALTQAHAKVNGIEYDLMDQPKSHYTQAFNSWSYPGYEKKSINKYLIFGLVLLLVPALNLSGLIFGNIRNRANEIGIRKSFGAARTRLLGELVTENFILTLVGAFLGLALSWLVIYYSRDWIFSIGKEFDFLHPETRVQFDMLFSPVVFIITLGAALILNTVSSFVPAWRALSRPIVESLSQKL